MIKVDGRILDQIFENNNTHEVLREFLYTYLNGNLPATKKLFSNKIYYHYFESVNTRSRVFLKGIYISTNYIFLDFINDFGVDYYDEYYVIGINSDGKLFINPINSSPHSKKVAGIFKNYIDDYYTTEDIYIFSVSDEAIYKAMGYDYDAEGKINEIPHDQNIFKKNQHKKHLHEESGYGYRIQGDVILEITKLFNSNDEMINDYKRSIKNHLTESIHNFLSLIVMKRIQEILSAYYIHTEYINDRTLRIACSLRNYNEVQYNNITRIIARILYNNLDVSDITKIMIIKYNKRMKIKYNKIDDAQFDSTITISLSRDSDGIEIFTQLSEKVISNYIDKIFNELNPTDLITDEHIKIGRHNITFKSLRRNITVRTKLDINDENNEIIIPIRLDEYWILPGKLKITHMEHGIHEYTIKYPLKGRFKNIDISNSPYEFNNKLTEIAINLLLNEKESRTLNL